MCTVVLYPYSSWVVLKMSAKVGFEDKEGTVPESTSMSLQDDSLFLRHD